MTLDSFSYYVGLDVHRKTISYCCKQIDGKIVREGKLAATWPAWQEWAQSLNRPWYGGLEATICSHWIYHLLKEYAADLKMGQPVRLKAISTAKGRNDSLDARTLADLLRCHLFPACSVPPAEYEVLQRQLRERALLVA